MNSDELPDSIGKSDKLWLFLDYDGTLADFAPTPDEVYPDEEVIQLLEDLVKHPSICRVAIISGRALNHIKTLVPVPGVILAGTYGIEIQIEVDQLVTAVEYTAIRPTLEKIKPQWESILIGRKGFYLEDKGWALAIHARYAQAAEADQIIMKAHQVARELAPEDLFRFLPGNQFFEVGSVLANKGRAVEFLLDHFPKPGCLPVYIGDDDKDEEAFKVVNSRGGISVVVKTSDRDTYAKYSLDSPRAVRDWLVKQISHFE